MSDSPSEDPHKTNNSDDVDPAAEFIAREQNVLAELEQDDSGYSASTQPSSALLTNNVNNVTSQMNGDKEPLQEAEKIKKWREEQKALLKAKDEEEAKKRRELEEQAKKELAEWYTRYKEQLSKSKQANRNAEKEWIAERDAETPGQEWEKIVKMCDFNPKSNRNTKDTSRMKSILLQLKQQPIGK